MIKPGDVGAADLLLVLTETPRPWAPTDAVPGGRVFSFTARERARIDRSVVGLPPEVAALEKRCQLVSLALIDDSGPVFCSAEAAAELTKRALDRLYRAVVQGLAVCGPEYGRGDNARVRTELMLSANAHPSIAYALGGCVDEGWHFSTERPDRFFGMPLGDLTDGQWMAFRACRAWLREKRQ